MPNEAKTLWISLGAGLFAAFLLFSYTQEKKAELEKKALATRQVVVASVDIPDLMTIDETMLTITQVPEDYTQPLVATDIKDVVGQVAAAPIKKNEQIMTSKLLSPGSETGLSLQVALDRRAFTLSVDEVHGVAKLIKPGDRVDILVAVTSGKGTATRTETIVMLQDITVLATGLTVQNNIPRIIEVDPNNRNTASITPINNNTSYNNITLELTLKQAQDLAYLQFSSPGSIFLALRNPSDRKVDLRMPSSSTESILGRPIIMESPSQPNVYAPPPINRLPSAGPQR